MNHPVVFSDQSNKTTLVATPFIELLRKNKATLANKVYNKAKTRSLEETMILAYV